MFSDLLKSVMWLELTSPREENITESYVRKKSSYNKLWSERRSKGWSVSHCMLTFLLSSVPFLLSRVPTQREVYYAVERKPLRLECSLRCALQLSHLPMPQAERMWRCRSSNIKGICSEGTSSATNTKLHQKHNQTDQMTAETTAGELNRAWSLRGRLEHSFNPRQDRHTIQWFNYDMP